jgi:hypothetical protein
LVNNDAAFFIVFLPVKKNPVFFYIWIDDVHIQWGEGVLQE